MNKPVKNQYGTYEYKNLKITRTGDKTFPWRVSLGLGTLNRYEFRNITSAAAFIDENAK